jgi:uncharacterized protein (DUF362 family)/Pyruvate/2-oxoacid:ferredoxin oxidoreductase delta subunit
MNIREKQDKSRVVVVPCDTYEEERVYEALQKGIGYLGGVKAFLSEDEKILLKLNLLNRAPADRAVTTHPAVFGAVARLLQEAGCDKLSYGDSPGHPGSPLKTAEICGVAETAGRYGVPMADFTNSRSVSCKKGDVERNYEICKGALDADAIVNICKMKTHQLTRVTGAVKNTFGCVCGLNKGAFHAKYPDAHSFAQMLIELNFLIRPRLHIMDGIVAMEGNGPMSGKPFPMGLLLISDDPVALDATFCRLINLDYREAPTVLYGEKLALGAARADRVEVLGIESLEPFTAPEFDVERSGKIAKKWALLQSMKFLMKRPVILPDKCARCGACVTACPVEGKAVDFADKSGTKAPRFNYRKCIRCFCCQEMCPARAIVVKNVFA